MMSQLKDINAPINVDGLPLLDPLRIAYCLPVFRPPDSSDTSILQQMLIAGGLKARGHALTFIAPRNLSDTVCTTDLHFPTLAPRTWSRQSWFELTSKITWRVQQWLGMPYLNVFSNYRLLDACLQCLPGHDIVQERNGLYKVGVAMACKRLSLPYIMFFDGDDIFEHAYAGKPITGILRWRAERTTRYNLTVADCVICVSETAKARLMNVWQVPEDKIAVFPNGVDVNLHRPYPETKADVRASLGVAANEPLIIFVGSFYPWQDVTGLLNAFTQILADCPHGRLVLVGDGQQREAMAQYVTQLGIDSSVQFTGFLPHTQVARLVSAADVAVAPYTKMKPEFFYGSSMKVFEYMASGVALIASDQGQIGEVVQNGVNGVLVPPGDTGALVTALKNLINDAALRSRLGQRAREDAIEKHSWEHYIVRLEQLYQSVISRRRSK
ncbi:MAG: glycosyltransferase family 4 protein [Hyphomicrobiales bacterium]|nr:glycosyltransferase family 4 protein [Hyphomicrobiales bacterium]